MSAVALTLIASLQLGTFMTAFADTPLSAARQSLPRVLVLSTGGTIAGKSNGQSAIGYDAGAVSGEDLIEAVPGIDKLARLKTDQVANIGSQNMNDRVWHALATRILKACADNEADAIVVTHGTDTMEETAFFLQNVIGPDCPVILTGAMRPSTAISADGPANLYEAVKLAATPDVRERGVMVVLNDTIHDARWVTKTNTTSLQTFKSPNQGPIGAVDPASVRFLTAPNLSPAKLNGPESSRAHHARAKFQLPAKAELPRVEIVYAHSNMDSRQIDNAVKDGAKGIVLAGVGDGNTSDEAIAGLARAVKKGVLVVRSSHVGSGFVNRNVEVPDDTYGFAVSYDLNPQKARILLQLLLASGETDPARVQSAFAYRP